MHVKADPNLLGAKRLILQDYPSQKPVTGQIASLGHRMRRKKTKHVYSLPAVMDIGKTARIYEGFHIYAIF